MKSRSMSPSIEMPHDSAASGLIVEINGESMNVGSACTLIELLQRLEIPTAKVAVEQNKAIIPRSLWSDTKVAAGDKFEIVHFVGGG